MQNWHGSFPFMIALVCAVDLILTVVKEINYSKMKGDALLVQYWHGSFNL